MKRCRIILVFIFCTVLLNILFQVIQLKQDKTGRVNSRRNNSRQNILDFTTQKNNLNESDSDVKFPSHRVFKTMEKILPQDAPSNVIYIWCGKKMFTFRNYLSVKSVIKFIQPPVITFIYEHYPVKDNASYNTWLQELEQEFPFWVAHHYRNGTAICSGEKESLKAAILDIIHSFHPLTSHEYHILYVLPNTVFTQPIQLKHYHKKSVQSTETINGYLLYNADKKQSTIIKCPQIDHNTHLLQASSSCVRLKSEFYPEDIIQNNSTMAAILRQVFYGDTRVRALKVDMITKAPNIAHYVWLGGGKMDLTFYLSVLSAIFIAKIDTIYIHGDKPPRGAYWNEVSLRYRHTVQMVVRYRSPGIFNQTISVVPHLADAIKSDIMYKYGGIMLDPDIIFIRPIDPILYHYEAVISLDIANNPPFPDMFNMGISISKPRSRFAKMWIESERNFVDKDWLWNCGAVTYKLWERDPGIALISRQLQMFCYQYKCHPLWAPRHIYQVILLGFFSKENIATARGIGSFHG